MFGKNRSVITSLPKAKTVCGVKIIKQPVGAYVQIMERMGGIIIELLEAGFPGQKPGEILAGLTKLTIIEFRALIIRLMTVLPEKLLEIMSAILGEDKDVLSALSPAELMRVWSAFWELNDLSYFFMTAREAILKATPAIPRKANTGSNGFKPPV